MDKDVTTSQHLPQWNFFTLAIFQRFGNSVENKLRQFAQKNTGIMINAVSENYY